MINNGVLLKAASKVAVAVGKEDLIEIAFASMRGTPSCMLTAYDGKGLQVQQLLTYEGEEEAAGKYIVKASTFLSALKLYENLGVEEIELKAAEETLTVGDANGKTSFPLAPSMTQLSQKVISAGAKGKVAVATKPFVTAVKAAATAAGVNTGNAKMNGIYFEADSEGKAYTLYTTDGFRGVRVDVNADITPAGESTASDMSFFAMPQIIKAAGCFAGEALNIIVGSSYVCIKDAENTIISVALNGDKFPVDNLKKIYTEKGTVGEAEGQQPVKALVTVEKGLINSAVELCGLVSTEETKTAKFDFERQGEAEAIFSISENTDKTKRTVKASVSLAEGDIPTFRANAGLFKDCVNVISGDKVTIKFGGNVANFYEESEAMPKAFLIWRNK